MQHQIDALTNLFQVLLCAYKFSHRSLCDAGTVEIIGPIASTVEDVMLV